MVATSPCSVVKVGNVRRRGGASEGRYLLVVANDKQIGRRRFGSRSIGILALNESLYRRRGGTHGGRVGVCNVGDKALTALPRHKVVELATEHAVCHDEIAHRCGSTYRLGIKAVCRFCATLELGRMVTLEPCHCSLLVGIAVAYGNLGLTAYHKAVFHRVILHWGELNTGQVAVARNTNRLDYSHLLTIVGILLVKGVVDLHCMLGGVALATRRLGRHHFAPFEFNGVVDSVLHRHIETIAQRHLDNTHVHRQLWRTDYRRRHITVCSHRQPVTSFYLQIVQTKLQPQLMPAVVNSFKFIALRNGVGRERGKHNNK